jgi:ABC-type sugar transport system substrate-binding protein
MADPPDLSPQIEAAAAAGVQSVTVDGQTTIVVPLRDQIEADRYLASKAAARSGRRGFRLAKIVPPGAG